ncbi:MAG: hypothetical protein JO128_04615 [Alphaproteobacteria bacterium]|nr:hypothetical protein [Alphaproteobacteria bacterium]
MAETLIQTLAYADWHIPLSQRSMSLRDAAEGLARVGAAPEDIPLMVRLAENPRFNLFHGAVDLETHDYIHAILGRGLLAKDEAFVIGFTMGSTNRLSATEEKLFTLVAERLYPGIFRFSREDVRVFRDAVRLAFICETPALNQVDYDLYMDAPLGDIRQLLHIDEPLLRAYYALEKRRYPASPESRRLLD